MIKKISAIVVALVLCLSVVVMPVSAYSGLELAEGMTVAFMLEWDKASYTAGETAYLNIYMTVDEAYEYQNGSITIGLNSSVISKDENTDVTGNSSSSDLWQAFYKSPEAGTISADWLASTYQTRVETASTEEEKAAYDQYYKIIVAKTTEANGGTHENLTSSKNGLPGAEINAVDGPMYTLGFVVATDCTAGVDLVAGITSGSTASSPAQTTYKYMTSPGSKTTTTTIKATAISLDYATTPEVAPSYVETTPTIVSDYKWQWRDNGDNTYAMRNLATIEASVIDGYLAKAEEFGYVDNGHTTAEEAMAEDLFKEFGFILGKGEFTKDAAAVWHQSADRDDSFAIVRPTYLSTNVEGKYVMSYIIKNVTDAAANVTVLGFVGLDTDVDGDIDMYYYYDAVTTKSLNDLKA